MSAPTHSPIKLPLLINRKSVNFQLNTGAAFTVITQDDFNEVTTGDISVQQCAKQLQTYTGESVTVVGECDVNVRYKKKDVQLPLVVVEGAGPPLLGRNWLQHIKLD